MTLRILLRKAPLTETPSIPPIHAPANNRWPRGLTSPWSRNTIKNHSHIGGDMASASNPCTGVCKFREEVCLSCGRLRSEKKRWKKMKKSERREVVSQSAARLAALGDQAIPSKKARRKANKRAATQPTHPPATPVRVRPEHLALGEPVVAPDAPLPIVDADAAREARKTWKKARKLARKAKKAARKAREAEARARGLPASEYARAINPQRHGAAQGLH